MMLSHPISLKQNAQRGWRTAEVLPVEFGSGGSGASSSHWAAEADGDPSSGPAASHVHPRLQSEAAAGRKGLRNGMAVMQQDE